MFRKVIKNTIYHSILLFVTFEYTIKLIMVIQLILFIVS